MKKLKEPTNQIGRHEPKQCADCGPRYVGSLKGVLTLQGAWLLVCERCRNQRRAVKAARTKAFRAQQTTMFP